MVLQREALGSHRKLPVSTNEGLLKALHSVDVSQPNNSIFSTVALKILSLNHLLRILEDMVKMVTYANQTIPFLLLKSSNEVKIQEPGYL